MPLSEKKRISNNRYLASMKTIALRMKPEEHWMMKESAQASGQSLQGYILQACRAAMDPATVSIPLSEDGVTLDEVKQAAEAAGMSVNAWIIQAIKDKL